MGMYHPKHYQLRNAALVIASRYLGLKVCNRKAWDKPTVHTSLLYCMTKGKKLVKERGGQKGGWKDQCKKRTEQEQYTGRNLSLLYSTTLDLLYTKINSYKLPRSHGERERERAHTADRLKTSYLAR